jgi:micrococcal nuclease
MFQYEAKVIRIIDGDTMIIDVDLGFKIHTEIDVRLARINTPEVVNYGAEGIEDKAVAYVMQCVPPGSVCVVNISRAEKYGRWLAEIYFQPGVTDRDAIMRNPRVLNDELMRQGLAQAYSGGKK